MSSILFIQFPNDFEARYKECRDRLLALLPKDYNSADEKPSDKNQKSSAQKFIHEHTHRFANSIQEKDIVLNHKFEKGDQRKFYITKENDDFRYKGQYLKLSKNADYYKVFCALFAKLPSGGEILYQDLIEEIKNRIPTTKPMHEEAMRKFIQTNLTDKNNGFMRYAKIPLTEDGGKPLIEIMRGSGVRFNNQIE